MIFFLSLRGHLAKRHKFSTHFPLPPFDPTFFCSSPDIFENSLCPRRQSLCLLTDQVVSRLLSSFAILYLLVDSRLSAHTTYIIFFGNSSIPRILFPFFGYFCNEKINIILHKITFSQLDRTFSTNFLYTCKNVRFLRDSFFQRNSIFCFSYNKIFVNRVNERGSKMIVYTFQTFCTRAYAT